MDWILPPNLQKWLEEIQARNRVLQEQFGIKPMTLQERAAAYEKRKKAEEEAKSLINKRRPAPKWKV